MKNQFLLWSLYLQKLLAYSFIGVCMCTMQGNLFAHAKNTQNISQKNVTLTGVFGDNHHSQYIPFMHKLVENKISQNIKHINKEEDEELRRRARQAEEDAAAARQAAEEARRNSTYPYVDPYVDPYYDDSYYDDRGPWFGFGVGGHRGGHHGWHGGHSGGHHGGGRRHK